MPMMSIFSLHTSVPCFRLCGGDSAAPGCMGEEKTHHEKLSNQICKMQQDPH